MPGAGHQFVGYIKEFASAESEFASALFDSVPAHYEFVSDVFDAAHAIKEFAGAKWDFMSALFYFSLTNNHSLHERFGIHGAHLFRECEIGHGRTPTGADSALYILPFRVRCIRLRPGHILATGYAIRPGGNPQPYIPSRSLRLLLVLRPSSFVLCVLRALCGSFSRGRSSVVGRLSRNLQPFNLQSSQEVLMLTSPDLYALVLRLRPERGSPPPNPQGHGAQALFLDVIRQVNPALAAELHAEQSKRPYTVAILPAPARAHLSDTPVELRVAFTRADMFPTVTQALLGLLPGADIRLGQARLQLADVFGTPEHHLWAGYSSFADLHASARPASSATLEFATPVAIAQGTRADGRARLALLPTPEIIFRSIARRWNDLAPPELHLDIAAVDAAASETLVSRYELATAQISLGKGPQKGFVGRCTYEFPPDAEASRVLALLADAVFFLGLGSKTARGMGLCRRVG